MFKSWPSLHQVNNTQNTVQIWEYRFPLSIQPVGLGERLLVEVKSQLMVFRRIFFGHCAWIISNSRWRQSANASAVVLEGKVNMTRSIFFSSFLHETQINWNLNFKTLIQGFAPQWPPRNVITMGSQCAECAGSWCIRMCELITRVRMNIGSICVNFKLKMA